MLFSFIGSFSFVCGADRGVTIAQLPNAPDVVILPDESVSFLQPEPLYQPQIFQGAPLKLDEVMALHIGRQRFKRYGGGYHRPIADCQEEYKMHITRNPGINTDVDYQAQDILSRLGYAVLYCNQRYPKVGT